MTSLYLLHTRRKLNIRRQHQRQEVTGLVVNERVNLRREVRRRLRAAEHQRRNDRPTSWTRGQLDGWRALARMVSAGVKG